MADAISTLGKASRDYEIEVGNYEAKAIAAANAKVDYEAGSAKFKLTAIFESDTKLSVALAEVMAMADDSVVALYREHKTTEAVLDAANKRITQLKEKVATGRTYVASERAADQIHATGPHTT